MYIIKEITCPDEKAVLAERILRALPNWFGTEEGIREHTENARTCRLFAAFQGEDAVGFATLREHNAYTSEIDAMGVLRQYHRSGTGRALVEACVAACAGRGQIFLTVKTLDASAESTSYARTRAFYHAMGFRPLQVLPGYWDEKNPCLFLALHIPSYS